MFTQKHKNVILLLTQLRTTYAANVDEGKVSDYTRSLKTKEKQSPANQVVDLFISVILYLQQPQDEFSATNIKYNSCAFVNPVVQSKIWSIYCIYIF